MTDESEKLFFDEVISSGEFLKYLISNTEGDNRDTSNSKTKGKIAILKNTNVIFPGVLVSISVKDKNDIDIINQCFSSSEQIGVVAYKTSDKKEIYNIGTTAHIINVLSNKSNNNEKHVILQGIERFQIVEIDKQTPTTALIKILPEKKISTKSKQFCAVNSLIQDLLDRLVRMYPSFPSEIKNFLHEGSNLRLLTFLLSSGLNIDVKEKIALLKINDCVKRAQKLIAIMTREIDIIDLKKKIFNKAQDSINKKQKDFLLRQQIDLLKNELGDSTDNDSDVDVLRTKGLKKNWNKTVARFFDRILNKADKTMPSSADYMVLINQAEFLLDLPWNNMSKNVIDISKAEEILSLSHYGMDKVKDCILEYLSVIKLTGKSANGQILCLVGPPGVGKTSLCRSIAKALGRDYVKVALGGIDDEADIRGHRKTYVGAMAGKILKGLQGMKSSNPVFVLDEIDKMTRSHGDPSAALLEVLDPDQNKEFIDNYAEVPYDLSKVFFIATANSLDSIPRPLLDRLEVIEISGYAQEEKLEICKNYIIPNLKVEYGVKDRYIHISDEVINKIITSYTLESGVRELERQITALYRKICRNIVEKKEYNHDLRPEELVPYLGVERYDKDRVEVLPRPGVAIGLAWTPLGGDILFIESALMPGKGNLTLSGKLGEVMKESATLAFTFLKANHKDYNIPQEKFDNNDVHIHVPEGATPKDGPSAGITLFSALLALFTDKKIKSNLAMTGEITLRGKILPVGGIKEKVLAAKRAGVTHIIMCTNNKKDVEEIKKDYIADISFHYVDQVKDLTPLLF
ncbi:MAG: endopeptidase La [Cytophagales bacterium]|nr:endopeptidase La [Cytophagales bacterium]